MQKPSYVQFVPVVNQPYINQQTQYVYPVQPQPIPQRYVQVPQQHFVAPIYPQQPIQPTQQQTETTNIVAVLLFVFGVICPMLWIINFVCFNKSSNPRNRQWALSSMRAFIRIFALFCVIMIFAYCLLLCV
ncbi:hypothetical protein QTN25_003364 [Entamoeba marina]